jgi:DcuC family C4-dicarboxylate transporter
MGFAPYLAILVTLGAGWGIVKKYQTHMVLFSAGLIMVALAVLSGVTAILPKGAPSSGFIWFDIVDLIRLISAKQASGIGLIIMVAGGFAEYMTQIGASNSLVRACTAPLKIFRQPYFVLALGYVLGQFMFIVIPSAAGLAMLLLIVVYPILVGLGVSRAAAAAAIGTTGGMAMGPAAGTAILAAQTAGLEPIVYFVQYQLPVGIPVMVTVGILHFIVQRYFDRKNDDEYNTPVETKGTITESPGWYALFPVLPIALLIVFSELGYDTIRLNTIAALFLVWLLAVAVEIIRLRDVRKVFKDAIIMFKSMGTMFATIVSLIIAAEVFAAGLKASGLIDMIIQSAHGYGLGMAAMTSVLTGIVGLVTFLTGSGVGAYSSFASLAATVAPALGGSIEAMVTPMQFAAGMFRAVSPVAGVIIAVAGCAGVTPLAIVRRTTIPMIGGVIVMMFANFILM